MWKSLFVIIPCVCVAVTHEVPPIASIQEALNISSSGDTVLVHPGIYRESLRMPGRDFVLISEYMLTGDSLNLLNTIIDATDYADQDTAPVMKFEGPNTRATVIGGFVMRGGSGYADQVGLRWAGCISGVYCHARFISNVLTENYSHFYPVFEFLYSGPSWEHNWIHHNAGANGLAAVVYSHPQDAVFEFEWNLVEDNYRLESADTPVFISPGFYIEQSTCQFSHNTTRNQSGDLFLGLKYRDTDGDIIGNVFENLNSDYWGFVIETNTYETQIRDNVFINCSLPGAGAIGLIAENYAGQFTIENNWFQNITNTQDGPSCIFVQNPHAIIRRNVFQNCGGGSGTIQISNGLGCMVEITQNLFFNCYSTWTGGSGASAIWSIGGGVLCSVRENWFQGNRGLAVLPGANPNVWDLSENYWGDSSGPYHPSLNPSGQGDTLGAGVSFFPWLQSPPDTSSPARPPLELPTQWYMSAPYPNPFNQEMILIISTGQSVPLRLAIYSLDGRLVADLWRGVVSAGSSNRVLWRGTDNAGHPVATGMYFIQAVNLSSAARDVKFAKVVLLR